MLTACLKLKTLMHHHPCQEWQAEDWTKVEPGLMSALPDFSEADVRNSLMVPTWFMHWH